MVSERRTRRSAMRRLLGVSAAGIVALAVVVVGSSPPSSAGTPKLKKPGPPTAVSVQPMDQGALLSWGPPSSDGGAPLTGYLVTVGSGARAVSCTTTVTTSCSVHGLTDGRQYRAKVRAINSVGQGKPSLSAKFVPGQSADCADFQPDADLFYCDLAHADLSGLDLAGVNFWGSRVVGADFSGADLSGAVFGGDTGAQRDLTDADFSGATMVGTSFESMYLYTVNFDGADLTDADFTSSSSIYDSFVNANLTGAQISDAEVIDPIWSNTICPNGSNSDDSGGTC